jgi:lactoylglutathione lyase
MTAFEGIGAITLFVDDVARSKEWYLRVFEAPLLFEDADSAVIGFGATFVNLLRRAAADELIAPALVGAPGGGAQLQLTLWVTDTDAVCGELQGRGVAFVNGPLDRPWGQRTACFADPDGHLWEIAQTLS